jgi:hypothetical protein
MSNNYTTPMSIQIYKMGVYDYSFILLWAIAVLTIAFGARLAKKNFVIRLYVKARKLHLEEKKKQLQMQGLAEPKAEGSGETARPKPRSYLFIFEKDDGVYEDALGLGDAAESLAVIKMGKKTATLLLLFEGGIFIALILLLYFFFSVMGKLRKGPKRYCWHSGLLRKCLNLVFIWIHRK